jgi:RNA polymerase sigma factor (sigma-70 family)
MHDAVQRVRTAILGQDETGLTDGQLLGRFLDQRDEAAVAALVRRHGPMVWGVCRRILADHHDAEDAFQATFLVLVRKAASIQTNVGNWLYGVAHHTALKARSSRARRRGREMPVHQMAEPTVAEQDLWSDLVPLLDLELSRLPKKYRTVIVLCDLESKTRREAAGQLGSPEGTVASWQARARAMLAKRLARHGLALTGSALATSLSQNAVSATVPTSVISATIKAVTLVAAGQAAATVFVSARVAALTEGVLKAMSFTRVQTMSCLLLTTVLLAGSGLFRYCSVPATSSAKAALPIAAASPATDKQMLIRELIEQLGDDNFQKRDEAERRLVAIGLPALELLRRAARESSDPEVRRRAARAAQVISKGLFGQVRQFIGKVSRDSGHWMQQVAVTSDGLQLMSAAGFDGLRTWDLKTGKPLLYFGGTGNYPALALSADGKRAIVGDVSNLVVHVYDLKTGKPVRQLIKRGHPAIVHAVALSADGKRAVTGGTSIPSLRVWDVETGKELRQFEGVRDCVLRLALSPDGKFVAAGHAAHMNGNHPGILRLWDLDTGKEIKTLKGHKRQINSVAFSPDGKRLLTTGDHTVRLWDVKTGKELKQFTGSPSAKYMLAEYSSFECAAFTPDGKRVLACGNEYDPTLRLWDIATGELLHESESVEKGFCWLAALPDSHHCVTAGKDGVVRLWHWKD